MSVKRGRVIAILLFLMIPFASADTIYNNFTREQCTQAVWVWLNDESTFDESQQEFIRRNITRRFLADEDRHRITVYNSSAVTAEEIQIILGLPSSLGIIRSYREEHGVPIEEPPCIERYRCKNRQTLAFQKRDCRWDEEIGDITCYSGCEDGKCLPNCADTDPGSNTSFRGTVTGQKKTGEMIEIHDYCNGNTIVEVDCASDLQADEDLIEERVFGCNDCGSGVCHVLTGNACIDYDSSPDYDSVAVDAFRPTDEKYINSTAQLIEYDVDGTILSETTEEDTCSGDHVTEWYCNSANELLSVSYPCPSGCAHGKCNPSCVDSDGNNTYKAGNVSGGRSDGSTYLLRDQCTGDFIHEKNCSQDPAGPGMVATENVYECSKGCSFGACINDSIPIITITQPSEGLIWKTGGSRQIEFEQENIQRVRIDYFIEENGFVVTDFYTIDIDDRYQSFEWELPRVNEENVTIMITGEHPDGSTIIEESENFTISNCTDSDGGDNIYMKGITAGVPHDGYGPVEEDTCFGGSLREFYLDGRCRVQSMISDCGGEGCNDGACDAVDICNSCGESCDWQQCDATGAFCEYLGGECVTVPEVNIYFDGNGIRRDIARDNQDADLRWIFETGSGTLPGGNARNSESVSPIDDEEWNYAYVQAEIDGHTLIVSDRISSQEFCDRLNAAECSSFSGPCMENPFDGSCDSRVGSCTDSDGGFFPYEDSALSSSFALDNPTSYVEECIGDTIMEGVCDRNNLITKIPFRCPYGCELGACKECEGGDCVDNVMLNDQRLCFDHGEAGCSIRSGFCDWAPRAGAVPGYCAHRPSCEYCGTGFFNICGSSECSKLGSYCDSNFPILSCHVEDNPGSCHYVENQIEVEFLSGVDHVSVIDRVDPGLAIGSTAGDVSTITGISAGCESEYIDIFKGLPEVVDAVTTPAGGGEGLNEGSYCRETQVCSEGCNDMDTTQIDADYQITDDSAEDDSQAAMYSNSLWYADDCGAGIFSDMLIERSCISGSIRDSTEDCSESGMHCDLGECREHIRFECVLRDSSCETGETEFLAFENTAGEDTDAHVGADYRWKVCCSSTSGLDVQYSASCPETTVITVENSAGGVDDAHVSQASFANNLCFTASPGIAECTVMPDCTDDWVGLFRFENSGGGVDDAHVSSYAGAYANAVCCRINYE